MKVGDLVRCTFQPTTSYIDKNNCAVPMEYAIKDLMGIVIKIRSNGIHRILFPQFGYEHDISTSGFDVIGASL